MKGLLSLIVATLFAAGCSNGLAVSEDIVLDFNVSDKRGGEVVLVIRNDIKNVRLDQDGKAEVVLSGYDAVYARLFYGMDYKWIYLEGGDHASISFKGNDFKGSFEFEGEKAQAVDYLNTIKLTALPDEDYALPFEEYLAKIKVKEQDAVKLLKANGLRSAGNFEKMEAAKIKYAYGATLLMHPVGHAMMTRKMDYTPDANYYKVIDSYLEDDDMLASLDEYCSFAVEAAHVLDEANRGVTALYPKTVAQMRFIAGRFNDEKLRNALLHYLAAPYVDRFGIDDIQEMENIYRTYVKDETLLADFETKIGKWNLSSPGRPSPAFSAVDINGKEWTLADFKGKYVYIDMWATWCAPCKREMPYLKELEKKFKDAQIVFLGLSVDRDKAKWEEMVKTGTLTGVQLYLGTQSGFQKAYNIDGIPRFILLDKEGVIISNDMTRPSAKETAETLEALPGIR